MFDIQIRFAICKVICGEESGTGFLVSEDRVITSRHCVRNAIGSDASIMLTFLAFGEKSFDVLGMIIEEDENLDICLLSLQRPIDNMPLLLSSSPPREGGEWASFGYPKSKQSLGHRISGVVETLHDTLIAKVDTDLSVNPTTKLNSYDGLSGSPVVIGGYVVGVLRLRLDNSLAAISIGKLSAFLEEHEVPILTKQESEDDISEIAKRIEFQDEFELLIQSSAGKYIFLEGPHGIGKTTFCRRFNPIYSRLLHLGTYCVRESADSNIVVNSQPSVLYDWLVTTISNLITGRSQRKETKNYAAMAVDIESILVQCGDYCHKREMLGVILLDGLNDVATYGEEQLKTFLGLLPSVLPENIVVVFAAPNFSSVASAIDSRVDSSNVVSLPPLPVESCRQYVYSNIEDERRGDFAFVSTLVDKAAGHPLYLNYLIRYANQNPNDKQLDHFPVLDGPIEKYYERLWQVLSVDGHTANLLAIICRLRQPILEKHLFRLLENHEQAVFSPTFSKIQHLFLHRDQITIYHDSFRVFLLQKTETTHETICERLATFCEEHEDIPYCVLNRMHHLLGSSQFHCESAIQICHQEWVDKCVNLSVQPDILLDDLKQVLKAALARGLVVESIRLLLLLQRVSFRYDTVFITSAGLVAKALIALGKPEDALQHVLRYDQLIVHVEEGLQIAWMLIEAAFYDEATHLLNIIMAKFVELYSYAELEISTFVDFASLHLLGIFFLVVSGQPQNQYFSHVLATLISMLENALQEDESDFREFWISRFQGVPNLFYLAFKDVYVSNADLAATNLFEDIPQSNFLHMRLNLIADHFECVDRFKLPLKRNSYETLLADIESTITSGEDLQRRDIELVVNALIKAGASELLICKIVANNILSGPEVTVIRNENGVDANHRNAYQNNMLWRIRAFTDDTVKIPSLLLPRKDTWQQTIEKLFDGVAILDGKARRALSMGDTKELKKLWRHLRHEMLPILESPLSERIQWQRSYAIPETILPSLFTFMIEVVDSCFTSHMPEFLDWILERCPQQLGIYTEGFRESLYQVIENTSRDRVPEDVKLKLFELSMILKRHVIDSVENRHELIPELLRVIPLFVRLGAHEEAEATYKIALKMSMGPTWYKEGQFGLLTSSLKNIPDRVNTSNYFSKIAGLLERASGEMTFQRFVRNHKAEFVGVLSSRGEVHAALWYLKNQTCGDTDHLFYEAGESKVDRVGPLIGNRYPGSALDEQDTILQFVENASLDWRLKWALLEIYQLGDYRHISSFASAFATLFNESAGNAEVIREMTNRIHHLITSDLPDTQAAEFVQEFLATLDKSFSELITELSTRFPVSPGVSNPSVLSTLDNKDEKNSPDKDQGNPMDNFFVPGFFGRRDAFDDADDTIKDIHHEISLGNKRKAHEKLIKMLRKVQESEWSIWDHPNSSTDMALSLLRSTSSSSTELIKCYHDLILNEKHAPAWSLADHLITESASLISVDEATSIIDVVLNHIELMVGNSESLIERFKPICSSECLHDNDAVFSFIEWLLCHPKWVRREKAAEVLVWLAVNWEVCSQYLANSIYDESKLNTRGASIGILDILSRENPIRVWQQLISEAGFDFDRLKNSEPHAFRLCTIYKIAKRAADVGEDSAGDTVEQLKNEFRTGDIILSEFKSKMLPDWAKCILSEWQKLDQQGITSQSLYNDFVSSLSASCAPYDFKDIHQIENLVLKSFREQPYRPLNRWRSRVIHALNCALTYYLSIDKIESVCQILSPDNPCAPCLTRSPNYESNFREMYRAILDGKFTSVVQEDNVFRLHYIEFGEVESESSSLTAPPEIHSIEIIAVMVAADLKRRGFFLPEITATFTSRELPPAEGKDHETCAFVIPEFSFLGTLTAAVPLDHFLSKASASYEDCSQLTWRNGRSGEFDNFGCPTFEGCSLSITKQAVQFKDNLKLAWLISVDEEVVGMVDAEGNELY